MKHKSLCYDMLRDASRVIDDTDEDHFSPGVAALTLVMDMTGTVDVIAPLPPRAMSQKMLVLAKEVIERYNDDSAPPLRAFDRAVMGKS
jgi:hypothetical protein